MENAMRVNSSRFVALVTAYALALQATLSLVPIAAIGTALASTQELCLDARDNPPAVPSHAHAMACCILSSCDGPPSAVLRSELARDPPVAWTVLITAVAHDDEPTRSSIDRPNWPRAPPA
jgi:hypothetical protein